MGEKFDGSFRDYMKDVGEDSDTHPTNPDYEKRIASEGEFSVTEEMLCHFLSGDRFARVFRKKIAEQLWGSHHEDGLTVCVPRKKQEFVVVNHVKQEGDVTYVNGSLIYDRDYLPLLDIHRQPLGTTYSRVPSPADFSPDKLGSPDVPTRPGIVAAMAAPFRQRLGGEFQSQRFVSIWMWQVPDDLQMKDECRRWLEETQLDVKIVEVQIEELLNRLKRYGQVDKQYVPAEEFSHLTIVDMLKRMNLRLGYGW
jgi:hypothetical protein